MPSLDPFLATAIRAALAAGSVIHAAARDSDPLQIREKNPNDFVTQVDLASEKSIVQTVLGAYPGHAVRSEESALPLGNAASDHVWIVDPLDGTTNFIHGYPQFAVSIALVIRGQVEHGVILDVMSGELFRASRGKGAFCGTRSLRVSGCADLRSAVLSTSCPARAAPDGQRAIALLCEVMGQVAAIRRSGSAALDLARIAAGQCDGGFDQGLNAWDVAAGSLLVSEAGGTVGNFSGGTEFLERREIVAGGSSVFAQLTGVLSRYASSEPVAASRP